MKTTSDAQAQRNFARNVLTVYLARFAALVIAGVFLAVGLSTFKARAQDAYAGQWIIESARGTNPMQLTLTYSTERSGSKRGRGESITSFSLVPEQLRGLTPAQMMSAGATVQFQLVRDAGTFNCEGWFKGGKGSGHFVFAGNPAFVAELRSRSYEAPTQAQLFSLAMSDTGIALLDELKAQGYERPTLDQLVRMGDHGVTLDYVRDLKAQGYSLQSTEALTRMVDHGVSISFIKEMDALGYKQLPAETLVRTVDHGVTPNYIKELATLGHTNLALEQLVRLVDHGVTARFIKEIEAAGYGRPSLEQLVRMQDHGVTPQFIQKIKSRGFNDLSIDELIKLADHGMGN